MCRGHHIVWFGSQHIGRVGQRVGEIEQIANGVLARDCFDTTQVAADRAFTHDFDWPNVPSCRNMRTTAQLERAASLEHSNNVAVFVAKKCDGTFIGCRLFRHFVGAHLAIGDHFGVRHLLDAANLSRRDGFVVAEVEPQSIRRHERAGLLHVFAQDLAQRPVQHMGRGVIAPGRRSGNTIDRSVHGGAGCELAASNAHQMASQPGGSKRGVDYLGTG